MGKIKPKERRFRNNLKYFLSNFSKKHRLSIRSQHNDSELWYIYISPLRMFLASLGFLLVMFSVVIAVVVYTPILDTLPGYPGKKSRQLLIENVLRLDSLEHELNIMRVYTDNVTLIMEGKTPVVRTMKRQQDTVSGEKTLIPPISADSLLRAELEGDGRYGLARGAAEQQNGRYSRMKFIPPIKGEVVLPFDPKSGNFSIGVAPEGSQQVVAVQDGTVIMSLWTPEDYYLIQIQHKDNYISVYKHNTQLLKAVGDRVEAGEVIGYVDMNSLISADDYSNEFIFELWHEGQPVDPQRYMFF